MEEPGHGIIGRESELAGVTSFIGSVSEGPSALLLEGTAGIGKTTLWHAGVSIARAQGHRVLACRAAESEARLSYAALGDLLDFELPDLPAPQQRALDAALLRAEFEGAPPDQRAVSVASVGVLRALATSGPVIVAVDDIQWLDAPSARVLAFVVRRLEDAPIRILVALRVGSGGDPLALARRAGTPPTGAHRPVARGGDDPPPASSSRGEADAPHLAPAPPDLGRESPLCPRDRPGAHRTRGPASARRTAPRSGGSPGVAGGTACRATGERR